MKKNIIVKGNIGTGKTRNVLFPKVKEAIKNKESFLTYSTTYEYLDEFESMVRKEEYNVITINFNDLLSSSGWNPLSYSYRLFKDNQEDEAIYSLEKFYKNLFIGEKNKSMDDFWVNSAEALSIAATLALFKIGDENKINIDGVFDYISDENLKDNLKNIDDKNINAYAKSFISSPKETTGGIISVCLETLRKYVSRDNLRVMLSNTSYNYEDIKNKRTAIFIICDEDNRAYVSLINAFISEVYALAKRSANSYTIILDEAEVLLPNLNEDFTYLIRGANKYGINFILGIHDEEMLKSKLGNYILNVADMMDTNN